MDVAVRRVVAGDGPRGSSGVVSDEMVRSQAECYALGWRHPSNSTDRWGLPSCPTWFGGVSKTRERTRVGKEPICVSKPAVYVQSEIAPPFEHVKRLIMRVTLIEVSGL
jgi:hypothetical protein